MTREDVIRIAGEAGFNLHHNPELYDCMVANYKSIERFAALVAEAEREACAKVCDSLEEQCEKLGLPDEKWPTPADCAFVIRARSKS
jgi:hypothetical protein